MQQLKDRIGARWIAMSIIGLVVLAATYLFFVRTYLGQYIENSALIGADQVSPDELDQSLSNLNVISMVSLVVVMIVYVILGFVRKSWRISIAAMATLGGATVITELLKKVILSRPDLAPIYQNNAHNSFPSGHTTIAMAIVASLIIILGPKWRGWIVIPAMWWAVGIGAAAVTARWHRFSDTLGADMVALTVAGIVAYWLLHQGVIRPETHTYRIRIVVLIILGTFGVISLAAGALLVTLNLNHFGIFTSLAEANASGSAPDLTAHLDFSFNQNMFYAAQSLAYGFSTLCALWFWGTFHKIGTTGRTTKALETR